MIKLGNTQIGKAYLGSTEIKKVYKGSDVVFDNSVAPLPYDAEIEYLQSSGTQWIDLNRKANSTDIFDLKFSPIAQVSATNGVFGARNDASKYNLSVIIASNNNIIIDLNNSNYATYRVNSNSIGYNKMCEVHISIDSKWIKLDNTLVASSTLHSDSFQTDTNISLFRVGNMSMPSIKLYSFKWESNDAIIMDLIPVRVGQVGYMYDKVSGQLFGNSGSGSFTLGNDVQ